MNLSLNYISELSRKQNGGGWDGINSALVHELGTKCHLHYVGPVRPRQDYYTKLFSKVRRFFGFRGAFPAYSQKRLKAYSHAVRASVLRGLDADFFHGATPWLCYSSPRAYFTYIDACFHTFLSHYQSPDAWRAADLLRLYHMERSWLQNASRVFLSSHWAAAETRRAYRLNGENMEVVGIGGAMPLPASDTYKWERRFLAVMTDFFRKGGPLCLEALQRVRRKFPDATLVFVGQAPPNHQRLGPGVEYAGFLRKNIPEEMARLTQLLASSIALLLPSKAETTPIIVAEAAYSGCPTIAPKSFGIPEMVLDGESGLLFDGEPNAPKLAELMLRVCQQGESYSNMRLAARKHSLEGFTWKRVVGRITTSLQSCLHDDPGSMQPILRRAANAAVSFR